MGELVRTETEDGVATIRIDRAPANALARPVSLELSEAAAAVADDDAIGAVVVWGGETIFAAGADIKAMVGYGPDEIASDVGALEQQPLGRALLVRGAGDALLLRQRSGSVTARAELDALKAARAQGAQTAAGSQKKL